MSGIPVGRTRIMIFAISGLMAALGGVIISSRIMAGSHNVGEGLEFEVIAAVVIGGTSLAGGSGSMIGTFLGVLFIGLAEQRHDADGRRPVLARSGPRRHRAGRGDDQRDPEADSKVALRAKAC